jgi:hypothetical protein
LTWEQNGNAVTLVKMRERVSWPELPIFVALPFDVADGSIVVGEPVGCPSAAVQGDAILTAHNALGDEI